MNRRMLSQDTLMIGLALLVAVALIAGCAAQTPPRETELGDVVQVEREGLSEHGAARPQPTPAPAQPAETKGSGGPGTPPLASPYRVNRLIIKNAELNLLMEDVGSGVDRVTQVAADTFGYILSSRTWYQGPFQYATITIGVPVDEFENALRRLRGMAVRVQDETASGTDVSDQYVDLESRLRNLEATEARIRSFLEQATNIEESLRINAQLTQITAQIEEIKGQMSYIKDRAAYSTITVQLAPQLPAPTPTPAPVPNVWRPGSTFRDAAGVLGGILRVVGDLAIWAAVVLGPFAVPAGLVLWVVVRAGRRRQKTG
jgi:uncharacterized protein DUF4349